MSAMLADNQPDQGTAVVDAPGPQRKRVVIVGGGFAGLAAAHALRQADAEVVVIDRRNHHIFQPLLYQVATAVLSSAEIAAPIRQLEAKQRNLSVLLAEVTGVDVASRTIEASAPGVGVRKIAFHYLVVATGMRPSYFGHDEFARYAPGLKSLNDAETNAPRILARIVTFSGKPLFGYRSMVAATMVICVLSCMVWLHHFFTMGASASVNAFFGIASMIIAMPTGVKVFNWLFTMYGGRIRFAVPVLWTIGFMVTFVLGGLTGVLLAVPPVDWQVHNSLFLIAHFHHVIIPGVVFGVMAGYTYWFPKAFGFTLNECWGRRAFWCWFIGFHVAFMPVYAVGLMGMTRRLQHYDVLSWQPWLVVAAVGAVIILAGIVCQVLQLVVSIHDRAQCRDVTGDPWNGRTLEWATASPPPAWNFAVLPRVVVRDAYWNAKQSTRAPQEQPREGHKYEPIEMPRNSAIGFVNAFFAVVTGFALVWHIWWMAAFGLIGAFVTLLAFAFRGEEEIEVPVDRIVSFERRHQAEVAL